MPRNRKIFYIAFSIFVLIAVLIAIDMASRTTPPWERRKDNIKKYDIDHFKKKL